MPITDDDTFATEEDKARNEPNEDGELASKETVAERLGLGVRVYGHLQTYEPVKKLDGTSRPSP